MYKTSSYVRMGGSGHNAPLESQGFFVRYRPTELAAFTQLSLRGGNIHKGNLRANNEICIVSNNIMGVLNI